MNRKNVLFALFIMVLSMSFIPKNVRGIKDTVEVPYYTFIAVDIEGGENDRISWEFESSDNKVELHVMGAEDYTYFEASPNRLTIEYYGKQLTGQVSEASGEFRPKRDDTWYFIFVNSGREEVDTTLKFEISNFRDYYIIVPSLIVFAIVAVIIMAGGTGTYMYLNKKKKKQQQVQPTAIQPQQQVVPQESPRSQPLSFEFCPECGSKVQNPSAKFCDNCAFDFKKEI